MRIVWGANSSSRPAVPTYARKMSNKNEREEAIEKLQERREEERERLEKEEERRLR
ncbi:hypothetical protein MMAGJ_09940 [Mycolicibacterium mageritense]|uniref:Uncharacterized protein n=2 Tax=Mycolicibacterium mageritense TaxID=53462 RepID=A0ABM7HMH3_MYCME|nr:hypothetical protein MMAGJ_09940 [Mycolicibacterium mageritense]